MRYLLVAAALVATPAMARVGAVPAATPVGKPVNCLRTTDIRETRVRSDTVIDFYLRSNRVLRNTLPYSCPELGFEQSFSYHLSTADLCSVDLITVLRHDGGLSRGATCGLGTFQPVTGLGR